jgi:RNA polymerase sigma-70 factor (ECF subfamily)
MLNEKMIHTDFERIYLAYFSKMKYFAKVYVLTDADAENIVQDVFTELWERREMLTMYDNVVSYLFSTVKNRCLNFLRHEAVMQEAADRMQEEHRLAMQASLNSLQIFDPAVFSQQDLEDVLARALDALPDRCREIFIMSKIEGKRQKDIAAELNISVNTVETQIGIAYRKLRVELKDHLPLFVFLLIL